MSDTEHPTEREFGELIEAVRGVRSQVSNLQRTNSAEHAANAQRMERLSTELREGLERKANIQDLKDAAERIDSLESDRDKTSTRDRIAIAVGAGAISTFAIFFGGQIHL